MRPQIFFSWKSELLKRIDKKVTLLLRCQFSCFIRDFSYSEARILYFLKIWSQKWHQTKEVAPSQERYRITKKRGVIVSMAFRCVTSDFRLVVFHFNNHFKFHINFPVKINEKFHVKVIFHHDKSNRMKAFTRICLVCFSGL